MRSLFNRTRLGTLIAFQACSLWLAGLEAAADSIFTRTSSWHSAHESRADSAHGLEAQSDSHEHLESLVSKLASARA
jgi:hypothetical protein